MRLLHNPEIRIFLIISVLITLILTIVTYFINAVCSIIILIAGIAFSVAFFLFERRKYMEIRSLSDELDAVLNEGKDFMISDMKEGDLSLLQNEIAKTTQQLKLQADHLNKDKQFLARVLADISHQLRTPVTSIRINLPLLKDPSLTDEKRKHLLNETSQSVNRIQHLIEELLKLSRLDAGAAIMKKEDLSVKEVIQQSLDTLAVPLDVKDVHVITSIDDSVLITVDRYWTCEAFTNILKNCMEHVQDDGTITITASETPLFTSIIIRDNGEGFHPDDIPHIFERFYKGKNASPSSIGIGLSLAKTIIHRQNGTIQASNNPEGGACFSIRFYKQIV